MAEMTPQVSDLLEKALALSTQERGLLIDHLIENLDEAPAEAGVEQAWDEEIKLRVDEIRSGKVKMIPGEQVLRELAKEFPDEERSVSSFTLRQGKISGMQSGGTAAARPRTLSVQRETNTLTPPARLDS